MAKIQAKLAKFTPKENHRFHRAQNETRRR